MLMLKYPRSVHSLHADGGIFVLLATKEEQKQMEAKSEVKYFPGGVNQMPSH